MKTNHKTLHGVSAPNERLSRDSQQHLVRWYKTTLKFIGYSATVLYGGVQMVLLMSFH